MARSAACSAEPSPWVRVQRFPYGPPTVRALLRVHGANAGGNVFEVGTDASWQQTQGPIIYDDEYNGETYDARLETPFWRSDTAMYVYLLSTHVTFSLPMISHWLTGGITRSIVRQ